MQKTFAYALVSLLLVSCAPKAGDNYYEADEVNVSRSVEFGTVMAVRDVTIAPTKLEESAGTVIGAGVGAGGGSYVGSGSGNNWATAGGAVAGAILGNLIANEVMKDEGCEYTLQMRSGEIKTIVERKSEGEHAFKPGDKVMLQYCDAGAHTRKCAAGSATQRLLPVDRFPPEAKKKKRNRSR